MRVVCWADKKGKRGLPPDMNPTHVVSPGDRTRCGKDIPYYAKVREFQGGAVVPCHDGCWAGLSEEVEI